MSRLSDFLMQKPVSEITKELVLNTRPEIKEMPFKIKAMSADDFNEYQEKCTSYDKKGKATFNSKKYNELVIVNHCIEPNFKDAEMLKKAGMTLPEQFIRKFLLAGEIVELSSQISSLSGFDTDINELKEEAKN